MHVAPGGLTIAAIPATIAAVSAILSLWPLAIVAVGLAVFVVVFYRDPSRTPDGQGILAPADGRIKELEMSDGYLEVAIFLNIHNVHVVRAPDDGEITNRRRVDGHRQPSFLSRAAENAGIEVTADGWTTTLRAGLIARRVRPYVEVGDSITRGDRLGHIAFGSRVDLRIPVDESESPSVAVGDRVKAGETVLMSR